MEFRDLKKQYLKNKSAIDQQIDEVVSSSDFILGKKVKELEEKLANYVKRKYCVSVGNGTDALELSLLAMGIKEGDAVFVPDFSYIASASVISRVHAHPVFVDIDDRTFNISCEDLVNKIEKVIKEDVYKPKAIIAVDLFGLCADYCELEKIANNYGLIIIEDAAQGFGGSINGKMACSFGNISCTSFFPAKPLGCYGDGGAIFIDDEKIMNRLVSLRSNGRSTYDKYDNVEIGMNSRLDAIQAGILLAKFDMFSAELEDINNTALRYTSRLKDYVITPTIPNGYVSSFAQYTILLKNSEERKNVISKLRENNIPSMIYYPKGLHEQKCFNYLDSCDDDYKKTGYVKNRCLSIPIYPYMEEDEIDMVCQIIKGSIK